MTYSPGKSTTLRRDAAGSLRKINHVREPFQAPGLAATPQAFSHHYVREVADLYGFKPDALQSLHEAPSPVLIKNEDTRLRLVKEKRNLNSRTIAYAQTYLGLPVWRSGFTVVMEDAEQRITSSTSTVEDGITVAAANQDGKYKPDNEDGLAELLKAIAARIKAKLISINGTKLWIYSYDPDKRQDDHHHGDDVGDGHDEDTIRLSLEPVPRTVKAGQHYVVTEVLFTLDVGMARHIHWRALIEIRSGAVLYERAALANVDAAVFALDPPSQTNDTTITACSGNAILNPLRQTVALQGLTAADPQPLDGEYITLGEQAAPNVAPPTEPAGSDFVYDADTDNFAAANAYYHCDATFRLIEQLGFDLGTYFGGTTFPITVDHRDATLGTVNAIGYGNATNDGSGGFGFNLVTDGCPVGIASDVRVVWHEFGHAILWDHVDFWGMGFSHSAGDSMAAIFADPDSQLTDRFDTFPFNTLITRRHDLDVTTGAAWGGASDVGGYSSESILATTMFRLYRSIGGDSANIADQRLASLHSLFLIIGATSTLTPVNDADDADDFATALMDFDKANDYSGISRGALHKVVRWAFEQQGLYQPPGAPVPVISVGAPPDVDVFIDDGRAGTYEYQRNFWNSQDMWNRLDSDGGTTHETPVIGVPNYMYVRVGNRGTQTATNVSVKAFNCRPSTGLVWPDDWQPMTTAQLNAPADIAPGGDVVVGPFEWTPMVEGHECLLAIASADGDPGNDTTATSSIPHSRLVPFDNNIGQRNVAPVPGGGGGGGLTAGFANRQFWFNNPFDMTIDARIDAVLPDFLVKRGWSIGFVSRGGAAFKLGPRDSRRIVMRLKQGQDFGPGDVPARENARIDVVAVADGRTIGGMSYAVDPKLKVPPKEYPDKATRGCIDEAQSLIDCLDCPGGEVKRVTVKRITVDIDLKTGDC